MVEHFFKFEILNYVALIISYKDILMNFKELILFIFIDNIQKLFHFLKKITLYWCNNTNKNPLFSVIALNLKQKWTLNILVNAWLIKFAYKIITFMAIILLSYFYWYFSLLVHLLILRLKVLYLLTFLVRYKIFFYYEHVFLLFCGIKSRRTYIPGHVFLEKLHR